MAREGKRHRYNRRGAKSNQPESDKRSPEQGIENGEKNARENHYGTIDVHSGHSNAVNDLIGNKSRKRHTNHKEEITPREDFDTYNFLEKYPTPVEHPPFADGGEENQKAEEHNVGIGLAQHETVSTGCPVIAQDKGPSVQRRSKGNDSYRGK